MLRSISFRIALCALVAFTTPSCLLDYSGYSFDKKPKSAPDGGKADAGVQGKRDLSDLTR
jgi:hypothetical protein